MKKYVISSLLIVSLLACNFPAGGNKSAIKITEDVSRYSDDMEPSTIEPNFGPAAKKRSDSTRKDVNNLPKVKIEEAKK